MPSRSLANLAPAGGRDTQQGVEYPQLAQGAVVTPPLSATGSMTVATFDQAFPLEVIAGRWKARDGALPQKGDLCLVVFDGVDADPWVPLWQGQDGVLSSNDITTALGFTPLRPSTPLGTQPGADIANNNVRSAPSQGNLGAAVAYVGPVSGFEAVTVLADVYDSNGWWTPAIHGWTVPAGTYLFSFFGSVAATVSNTSNFTMGALVNGSGVTLGSTLTVTTGFAPISGSCLFISPANGQIQLAADVSVAGGTTVVLEGGLALIERVN